MNEWKEYKLWDVTTKIGSGATPRGGSNSYKAEGISLIRSQNVLDLEFSTNGIVYIDEVQAEELKNVEIKQKDILLNITGDSVARVCMVPNKIIPARVNQHVSIIRADDKKVLPEYILYYLISQKEELLIRSEIGATRKAITKGMIEDFKIIIPPLPEQNAIASVLSSLDDKIDLLHRQNETLEKMAEALFREWFVEEAKEDWEEGKISDVANHSKNSILPQKNKETLFYHYSIPAFDNSKDPIKEFGKEIQSNKYILPDNCVLFSKLNPHKDKRVWLLQDEVRENSICSTEFQIIKPKNDESLFFLFGWLTYFENYNEIASGVGGTSGSHQRIDPTSIFSFQCPLIPEDYIKKYNLQVESLFRKQTINLIQIQTLMQIRDTLLPKLMSGEVSVA